MPLLSPWCGVKISEAKKGLRVRLVDEVRKRYLLDTDLAIDLRRSMLIPRGAGTLRSGRVLRNDTSKGYREGLVVYVKWDELPTAEAWDLTDLEPIPA